MIKKIVANLQYDGLGVPIELHSVEMVSFENEYHPRINVRQVADVAMQSYISQKEKFTGNQITFMRTYFLMSQDALAKLVKQPTSVIKKWEEANHKPANMEPAIEKLLKEQMQKQFSIKKSSQSLGSVGMYSAKKKSSEEPPTLGNDQSNKKKKR
jgi:DNA-binding transcriptional regulator YiaG